MNHERRVKEIRARARVRRWEFRQRNLAHGAWMRFRTALAHASEAFAIDEATARQLMREGFAQDTSGVGLAPPRTIVWITAARAAELAGARPLQLRLDAPMLSARHLALVPFLEAS